VNRRARADVIAQLDLCLIPDALSAYVRRTRLKRALNSCTRLAALEHVNELDASRMAEEILGASRHLCNPSETFDDRWQEGWIRLQMRLSQLRDALYVA